jgi:hypothetical protein
MYLLIIQWSIISLILIILIHYLYSFFQTTLTIPKIKDLVNRPANAYKEMYETINNDNDNTIHANHNEPNKDKPINSNGSNSNQNMKDELKSFLTNLNNSEPSTMNNISSFEYGNLYSNY